MATQIQLRRGTAAAWTSANPVLAEGEMGVETDTSKHKVGDGTTAWNSLGYATTVPSAHALGGAEHTADTLANLNAKITDATLIDTGDSRLSDSRTCNNTFDNAATARANLDVYSTSEVDSKVVGLYDHKGAYDANTNTPDLDTSPSGIKKGDAYSVSVAGNFFAEAVEVGDVLIADQDDPTLLSHWTRVNKNISFGTTAGTACEGDDARLSDARTPTAHNHTLADVTDSGALAAKNTIATGDVDDAAITYAKMQDVSATDRILGRDSAGAGDVEEITPAALRTMINVADGANNYSHPNHSGEVTSTGDGAQVVDKTAITNKTTVTAVAGDFVLVSDTSDAGNLKKVDANDFLTGGGSGMVTGVSKNSGATINAANRSVLNFIEGSNVTLTIADDAAGDEVDITIAATGGGGAADLAAVQARRTTTLGLTASWQLMTFNSTDLENDAAVVEHNNTTTSRIDIKEAGIYLITHSAFVDITDTGALVIRSRLLNKGVVIPGSEIDANNDEGNAEGSTLPLSRTVLASLAANDYIEVQYKEDSGAAININTMATLSVVKLEGVQGAVGPAGADGDITWQGTWTSQNYTANQAVFYAPTGASYVCHTNTTAQQVPTDTGYWDVLAEKGATGTAAFLEIITTASHNAPDVAVTSSTYTTLARHAFRGSAVVGTPSSIKSVARVVAGTGGKVRVYDATNSLVIAELTGISNTSDSVLDLGTISNVPAGEAVWEIQIGGDDVNATEHSSVSIYY